MKGIVICNGIVEDYNTIKCVGADLIVCADGGADHAYKAGVVPHCIIGDLDSISDEARTYFESKGVEFSKYPRDKDETDTHLAINYCIAHGCDDITLYAALGGRFDHAFANVSLLAMLKQRGISACIVDGDSVLYVSDDELKISGKQGDLLSLLPLGNGVTILFTDGLYYAVKDRKFPFGYPFGVSNVFADSEALIRLSGGWLLAVHTAL